MNEPSAETRSIAERVSAALQKVSRGALAATALVVGLVVMIAVRAADDESTEPVRATPTAVDETGLKQLSQQLDHPVYWAGRPKENSMELSETKDGSVYVRYLPPKVELGDERPEFLTVGTYPVEKPVAKLRRSARQADTETSAFSDKARSRQGQIFVNPEIPTSAFFAFRGADIQVEVFHPDPGVATKMVKAGLITPVR